MKAVKHLWGFPEITQTEMSGDCPVCILFSLTTDVQILISGIKLLSSWEHPVQNSWRSCSQRYGTMLRTDPSMLASLSPNFFQTLSSQLTRNTTNSKVCWQRGMVHISTARMKWRVFFNFSSVQLLSLLMKLVVEMNDCMGFSQLTDSSWKLFLETLVLGQPREHILSLMSWA